MAAAEISRPSVPALIEELKQAYNGRAGTARPGGSLDQTLVHIEKLPARDASFLALTRPLPPALEQALARNGIDRLYSHQAEAVEALRAGRNVALVTATASGKTLSFNLPVLETLLEQPAATALYIFPTNALMNDQLATLQALLAELGETGSSIRAFKYNGTMSDDEKKQVRVARPRILLTNPELVHLSLTAWHRAWPGFLRNLKYVVVDEVHTYRGVFGSHIAHLLRRLRRVCAHYGANPQFICCSATIGNPQELVRKLTGLDDFVAVTKDGARKNERYFIVWKPPSFISENSQAEPVTRSYLEETVDLFKQLTAFRYGTLCFSRTRRYAETMYRMCRESSAPSLIRNISVYRAGLRADERISIERGLKDGTLDGVFSTNALELGIDIGGLDAVIIAGYPGSQMALWQQAGRAGRGDKDAVIFLVASQNPVDQYFLANPAVLFSGRAESALLSVENEFITRRHLLCMAKELPFDRAALSHYYEPATIRLVESMIKDKQLAVRGRGVCYFAGEDSPHHQLSLRSSATTKYTIINQSDGREIGLIEPPHVYTETHPGAIYTHGGETYRVASIDEKSRQVLVMPIATNHMTTSVAETEISLEKTSAIREIILGGGLAIKIAKGLGEVIEKIYGYREAPLFQRSRRPPDIINLEERLTIKLRTELLWLELPPRERFATLAAFDSGLHGLEHLLAGLFPLEVMCDPTDIGATSYGANLLNENRPAIYFFDSFEGGAGFAHGCYEHIEDLLQRAYGTVKSCRCKSGCPACVESARCREASDRVSKEGTRLILQRLLG